MNGRLRRTSTLVAVRIAGGNPILSFDEQKGADIPTQTITRHWWFDKEAKEAAELTQDRYGLSWQVVFVSDRKTAASVAPILRYVKEDQPTNDKEEEQIDYFWSKLSAEPRAEQCGWLKDRFGLSWQIVPTAIDEMLGAKDPAKLVRVTETFLKMREFDIAKLKHAYSQGKSAA